MLRNLKHIEKQIAKVQQSVGKPIHAYKSAEKCRQSFESVAKCQERRKAKTSAYTNGQKRRIKRMEHLFNKTCLIYWGLLMFQNFGSLKNIFQFSYFQKVQESTILNSFFEGIP